MTSEIILIWFIGSVGVICGVITLNYWLDKLEREKEIRSQSSTNV